MTEGKKEEKLTACPFSRKRQPLGTVFLVYLNYERVGYH
jgi:hypothetical protein